MNCVIYVIVGIDKTPTGDNAYRVLACSVAEKSKHVYDWKFNCVLMNEQKVMSALTNKQTFINAKLESGRLKGSSGSLERFKEENRPMVILSQIVDEQGKLLGYKVANYDGVVRNISLKEMLAYGTRVTKANGTPVQNAIFVPAELNERGEILKAAHYKTYPNCHFIVELVSRNEKRAEVKKVPLKENEKSLSRLEEIYNKDQLMELKLGKEAGLDIRIYANPALTAAQMAELRNGLSKKLNVKPIAHPEYNYMCMRYYITCLADGLDIRSFLNPSYNIGQISELSLAVESGLDISKMSNPNLSADEMAEIRERLERNIWKDIFVTPDGAWSN